MCCFNYFSSKYSFFYAKRRFSLQNLIFAFLKARTYALALLYYSHQIAACSPEVSRRKKDEISSNSATADLPVRYEVFRVNIFCECVSLRARYVTAR